MNQKKAPQTQAPHYAYSFILLWFQNETVTQNR